jgi:peroxiredoxin
MLLSLLMASLFSGHFALNFDSFRLPLQQTQANQLALSDSLSVYIFLEDECLISQYYTNELSRLYQEYGKGHVGFIGYFPSSTTGTEEIAAFADKFKLDFALLPDHDFTWTKRFEITVTPEVAVLDHRTDRMIYKGRIDDSYVRVGKRKLHSQKHDLEDIIKAWQLNQVPSSLVQTEAIGCFITFTK